MRRIEPTEARVNRLAVLVEVLLVYIVISSAIGGWFVFDLVEANANKNTDTANAVGRLLCGAGLARVNTVLNAKPNDPNNPNDYKTAQGYFHILKDLGFHQPYPGDRDKYGEQCPYPRLTKQARLVVTQSHAK